jgi:hypothetical protein
MDSFMALISGYQRDGIRGTKAFQYIPISGMHSAVKKLSGD